MWVCGIALISTHVDARRRYSVSAASEPPEHPHFTNVPTSTRLNPTTMNPVQEAIEDIESRELGDEFSCRKVAIRCNVGRTTLSRRHQRKQATNTASGEAQRHLNPQQEQELVQYIERCTRRGLPPTREMLQNFASAKACEEMSAWRRA
jgi:hypothetical protein